MGPLAGAQLTPASADASFRRYFRLTTADESYIVMDAPPAQEDCRPFIRIAGYLDAMQLNAPRVIEANLDDGFLLLSDLGSRLYLDELEQDPDSASGLYADAIDALLTLQTRGAAFQSSLPPYDAERFRFELSLFHDWLCGEHLRLSFSAADERAWLACCDVLTENALQQPQVFVHRDYHSRNLMLAADNNPGILDFQDAMVGPLTYDLVSLLKDCYVSWPAEQVRQWALQFYSGLAKLMRTRVNELQFCRYFELMGAQRHLKAAGIFARLKHRDGKAAYLADIPRTLAYISGLRSHYEELEFVVDLIDTRVLPALAATI
ncbi:MAG: phosphotransferase [Woeseiaceae bacterium]|nr:phosphotransferase [Woeseiaceae bacterium]